MPAILHEVPGYVQHQDHSRNAVQVKGGSNWDLSRSALETPIKQLVDPEPVQVPVAQNAAPDYAPATVVVSFSRNSSVVPQKNVKALQELKGVSVVTVVGHADKSEKAPAALATKRAEAVAKRLRPTVAVVQVRTADVAAEAKPANRRVDVVVEDATLMELVEPSAAAEE